MVQDRTTSAADGAVEQARTTAPQPESLARSRAERRRARRGLRRLCRCARRGLDSRSQRDAALRVARVYRNSFAHCRRIGGYVATDGEVDPEAIAAWAQASGKTWFLPRITRSRTGPAMRFAQAGGGEPVTNRFGIPEPSPKNPTAPCWTLDLLIIPLVAFDGAGNRLGRGAGFYDRLLAAPAPRRPRLIGIAHACQRCVRIPAEDWDVPLEAVLTPEGIVRFPSR